jgi:hypothetical protein
MENELTSLRGSDIEQLISDPTCFLNFNKIYAHPNIPGKKLAGAISSYAKNVEPSEVLILIDNTVLGGAEDGVLVTRDAIYAKQSFENAKFLPLKVINSIEIRYIFMENGRNLIVDGVRFVLLHLLAEAELKVFVKIMTYALRKNTPPSPNNWNYDILPNIAFWHIYVYPNIPDKKLAGAISSYAKNVEPSEVAILIDDTALGGAKTGVLVTRDVIYAKVKMFRDGIILPLRHIRSIEATGRSLMVNGAEFAELVVVDEQEVQMFVELITKYFLPVFVQQQ